MHFLQLPAWALTAVLATPAKPQPGTEIEIEIVETRPAGPVQSRLVVPLDGMVAAYTEIGKNSRRCEAEAKRVHEAVRLKLRCTGSPELELTLEATRPLTLGQRIRLAQISPPGTADSQVFVTMN